MSQDPGLSHRFVAEAREHLAAMSSAMIALERNEGSPEPVIEQLLRAAHSVKGGAGLAGRNRIQELSHAFEEVIEQIRDGRIARSSEVIDRLLGVLDRITAMVDDVEHSDEVDISDALGSLRQLTGATTALTHPAAGAALTGPTVAAREFEVTERLRQLWPEDAAYLYGVKLDWWQCERRCALVPLAVAERIERAGRVLEAHTRVAGPGLGEGLPQPPFWYLAVLASPAPLDEFTRSLDIPCATIVQLLEKQSSARPAEAPGQPSQPARPRGAAAASSLRVSVPLVDRMMALAGELVLVRNQALRSADPANAAQRRLMRRLDSVTNELQDAALRMRTQPVATLFDRFPRLVRDVARQLGKQIEVRISGAEVELDKTILELLADPLTHLIRNSCDHGVETPDKRTAAGKSPGGLIELSARQERGQIVIEVRDDGRGIDVQAVKRKAAEQGLRRPDELERMADQQVYGLILLSGFSTAKQVTDLSGRGVGMDVVKTNLDQIGGVIEINSTPGRESVFTLRLPLTLAIMPCLLIGIDGHCYGLPQRDVEEIVLLGDAHSRRRVERNHEREVIRWRGRLLAVVRARELVARRRPFDPAASAEVADRYHGSAEGGGVDPARSYAAVVRLGSRRFAVVFDEVLGSENIVVKPLHPLLRPLGIYAATTILGDGRVSMIFSGEGMARHGGVLDHASIEVEEDVRRDGPSAGPKSEPVLLFRSGRDDLLAARMQSIRRVVAITPDRIERLGDRELVNVDGAATNVVRIDRFLNLPPNAEASRMFLLLPRDAESPVGLLASEIVDTPTLTLDADSRAFRAEGVIGSLMIREQIALLLDVERIIGMWEQLVRPSSAAPTSILPEGPKRRILVVDDTRFFQNLVGEHLRAAGYEVTVAENGERALATLREGRFDGVVSDIEMPVLDGHGLARAVRAEAAIARIPMVALTTLNTDDSRAAAAESGFDAYEVKLDRQSLLDTVARVLSQQRPAGVLAHRDRGARP